MIIIPSVAVEVGIFLYEYIIILVACAAVVLAIIWKRNEFLAGLFFLFLYTILDAVTIMFSMFLQQSIIDASQFGFILLALISFINGMRPSVKVKPASGNC